MNFSSIQFKIRTIVFLFLFWFVGIILALWLGLGWFFLSETIRRIITAIPKVYLMLLRVLAGPERASEEEQFLIQKNVRIFYVWRLIMALVWLILTIVVFLFVNIKLTDFLN